MEKYLVDILEISRFVDGSPAESEPEKLFLETRKDTEKTVLELFKTFSLNPD